MGKQFIYDAIGARSIISFLYTGSRRIVEPHVLGYDHGGELTLYAWQPTGCNGQNWRNFHYHKIHGIALTGGYFSNARPGFDPHNWDLTEIVCCVSRPGAVCWPDPRGASLERRRCEACERRYISEQLSASKQRPAPHLPDRIHTTRM